MSLIRLPISLRDFLNSYKIGGHSTTVAVATKDALPCGCAPTKAARRSGRRGLTVTADGEVKHTRCGVTIGRLGVVAQPGGPQPGQELFPH